MGICLDTDAFAAENTGDKENEWNRTQNRQHLSGENVALNFEASDNSTCRKIKFDTPKVPIIFVLGGPGSGKVTHCDTFMQERRGITHINMMDLLQQYAMGNDMQDFSQLSSKIVTEVLMLEMKMAPASKAFLISGFPRSMRDVVEYSEKIQLLNGVILISWRQSVLQKQIDYGAKLGHVILSLAKMELENFFKNVMPVADYFDQSDILIAVNGERSPDEVYADFRAAVLEILSSLENPEAILNGVTGIGRGVNDIPGSIVSVDTAPNNINVNQTTTPISITKNSQQKLSKAVTDNAEAPNVLCIIGGPGSNKTNLCLKTIGASPSWGHISMGKILRTITECAPRSSPESQSIKEALAAGELAPEKSIYHILDKNMVKNINRTGVIIDGFPRSLQQLKYYENKYKQRPPVILLDCSKLQLGRGRIDDTVSSFRRRLELFREQTLPMLKFLDNSGRLQIIDGDTDSPSVQREFERVVLSYIKISGTINENANQNYRFLKIPQSEPGKIDAVLHDLELNATAAIPSISHHVSLMADEANSGDTNKSDGSTLNGNLRTSQQKNFKQILEEAEWFPIDS